MKTLEDYEERAALMEFEAGLHRTQAEHEAWEDILGEPMPYFADSVIFAAAPPDDLSIQAAKNWIKERGYTSADVSLKKSETTIYVVAKRELE